MHSETEVLRHLLATLAYRAHRALEEAPEDFGQYAGAGRTPVVILAHMGDLLDWSLGMMDGRPEWKVSEPLAWADECQRFHQSLTALDQFLAIAGPVIKEPTRLLQGPLADALTHVGQLAMIRRMAGAPTRGENFYIADVRTGCTGAEQPEPVRLLNRS